MRKTRLSVRVSIYGRNAWQDRSAGEFYLDVGKKSTRALPADVVDEVLAAGQKLRIEVTALGVYGTPTYETLHTARHAVVALAPLYLKPLFEQVERMRSWDEWDEYRPLVIEAVLDRADVVETQFFGERARCPLCGDWPAAPGPSEGFAYPTGLTWHLEGRGNTRHCDVMKTLQDWAVDRL